MNKNYLLTDKDFEEMKDNIRQLIKNKKSKKMKVTLEGLTKELYQLNNSSKNLKVYGWVYHAAYADRIRRLYGNKDMKGLLETYECIKNNQPFGRL